MQLDTTPICRHTAGAGGEPLVSVLARHGVPNPHLLRCPDVHDLAVMLGRANYAAFAERALFAELAPPAVAPVRFERRSAIRAAVLGVLTLLAFVFACGFFGKILLW